MAWSGATVRSIADETAAAGTSGSVASRYGIDLAGPLPAVLCFVACALIVATLPPISDHAWQFYMAERLLDGARLYVDVGAADMHPPLFTWIAVIVSWIGRLIHVSGFMLYPVVVFLAAAISIRAWSRVAPASGWMLIVLVVVLLPLAGPYYGQSEHLALILALPYLGGAAAALRGRPVRRWTAFAHGAGAGIGFALKPHFALVWLCIEVVVARRRGARSLLRTESITVATLFAAYLVAALVVTPELFRMMPWLMKLYPRFAPVAFSSLIVDWRLAWLGLGLVAAWFVRADDEWGSVSRILASAAIALYAALLLQGKGWGYHWYPVCAVATLLCGAAVRPHVRRIPLAGIALAVAAVPIMQYQWHRTARLIAAYPGDLPALLDAVEANAPAHASILGLTHLLQPGFPLVNITDSRWSSPYAHLWMVPAIYADAWTGRGPVRYRESGEFRALEQEMFDRLWNAVERDDPDIIILQRPTAAGFDMRAYFETDERFRDRFARSPLLSSASRYTLLGRPARP